MALKFNPLSGEFDLVGGGGSSSVAWGDITGDIADQIDLDEALTDIFNTADSKVNGGGITSTGKIAYWFGTDGKNLAVATQTASRVLITNASNIPTTSTVTSTELALLSGKTALGDVVGPASSVDNRLALFDSTTGKLLKQASAITASRALVSDANGVPSHSSVTSTELGYVAGVSSAIQTQMDLKAPKDAPTFTTSVTFGSTAASSGAYRLPNANLIAWRNAANSANYTLGVDANNVLVSSAAIESTDHLIRASNPLYKTTLTADTAYTYATSTAANGFQFINPNINAAPQTLSRLSYSTGAPPGAWADFGLGNANSGNMSTYNLFLRGGGEYMEEAAFSAQQGGGITIGALTRGCAHTVVGKPTITGLRYFNAANLLTTTANATTSITVGGFPHCLSQFGIGDWISLSSASSTYTRINSIASETAMTVAEAIGNGTSQNINKKQALASWQTNDRTAHVGINPWGTIELTQATNGNCGSATANETTEVTVNNTKITANTLIFFSVESAFTTFPYVSTRTAGTSFGFKAGTGDTGTVKWFIVEPF